MNKNVSRLSVPKNIPRRINDDRLSVHRRLTVNSPNWIGGRKPRTEINTEIPKDFIESFIQNYVLNKNLEYLTANEKEDFIRQIKQGVQDRVISEEIYQEIAKSLNTMYTAQMVLEQFTYNPLKTPNENGVALSMALIRFEDANEYFKNIIDKFANYYEYAERYCATNDTCSAPCESQDGRCIYPYDQDRYQNYWDTHLAL